MATYAVQRKLKGAKWQDVFRFSPNNSTVFPTKKEARDRCTHMQDANPHETYRVVKLLK